MANEANILNNTLVCETAQHHQPNDDSTINGIKQLMREAQSINNTWLNSSRKETKKVKFDEEDPFIEDEHQVATRVGYLYRIWKIQEANEATGKKEKKICVRCTVHSHVGEAHERRFVNTFALNEYDREGSNWRNQISDITTVLNKEIFDNMFKVNRWVVQSLLADVEFMKLAFITRKTMNDNKKHVVLATHTIQTKKWAQYNNLSLDKMWPILRYIIDCVENSKELQKTKDQEEGKQIVEGDDDSEEEDEDANYVLLKDYMGMSIKLYKKIDDEEEENEDNDDD